VLFVGTSFTGALLDVALPAIQQRAEYYYYASMYIQITPSGRFTKDKIDLAALDWQGMIDKTDIFVLELLEAYLPSPYANAFLGKLDPALGIDGG
jgi:hypothetical protein